MSNISLDVRDGTHLHFEASFLPSFVRSHLQKIVSEKKDKQTGKTDGQESKTDRRRERPTITSFIIGTLFEDDLFFSGGGRKTEQ
jgi:hypothetical protein